MLEFLNKKRGSPTTRKQHKDDKPSAHPGLFDKQHACLQAQNAFETKHRSLCKCDPRCLRGGHVSFPIPAPPWRRDRRWAAGRQEMDPRDTNPNFAPGLPVFHLPQLGWFSVFHMTTINTVTKYTSLILPRGTSIVATLLATKGKCKIRCQISDSSSKVQQWPFRTFEEFINKIWVFTYHSDSWLFLPAPVYSCVSFSNVWCSVRWTTHGDWGAIQQLLSSSVIYQRLMIQISRNL